MVFSDDEVLFLSDIFPTGFQGPEQAGIKGVEIVAIWGGGPVGYFAIQSFKVIETVPERIALARKAGATDIIDFEKEDVFERIKEINKGEGADVAIDCVGMEASAAHGRGAGRRQRKSVAVRGVCSCLTRQSRRSVLGA